MDSTGLLRCTMCRLALLLLLLLASYARIPHVIHILKTERRRMAVPIGHTSDTLLRAVQYSLSSCSLTEFDRNNEKGQVLVKCQTSAGSICMFLIVLVSALVRVSEA